MDTKACGASDCPSAGRKLPAAAFYKDKSKRGGLDSYCKVCRDVRTVQHRADRKANDPHALRQQERLIAARHRYGLSKDDVAALWEMSGGRCAICKRSVNYDTTEGLRPSIDHCHSTGKVRGILCLACNRGLGQFKDDPVRLEAAALYLTAQKNMVP